MIFIGLNFIFRMSFILHNHVSTNIIFGHEPTSLMVYSGNNIAELGRERKRKKKKKKTVWPRTPTTRTVINNIAWSFYILITNWRNNLYGPTLSSVGLFCILSRTIFSPARPYTHEKKKKRKKAFPPIIRTFNSRYRRYG